VGTNGLRTTISSDLAFEALACCSVLAVRRDDSNRLTCLQSAETKGVHYDELRWRNGSLV
jgi:hypothetical protein